MPVVTKEQALELYMSILAEPFFTSFLDLLRML